MIGLIIVNFGNVVTEFAGIAGSLARKKYVPPSLGTFPVTTPLFSILLVSVIGVPVTTR